MTSSNNPKGHAHRWTLRVGPQVVSAVADGPDHQHEIRGGNLSGPPMYVGDSHTHELLQNGIAVESGPPITPLEAYNTMNDYGTGTVTQGASDLNKGNLPDLVDPQHLYVFRSGFDDVYDYWYIDQSHNYWRYTNAPEESPDHDPQLGIAVMAGDQPTPTDNPQFFTAEGQRRHMAVPPDIEPERNEEYNPIDPKNLWFEIYEREGEHRYIYLDSDVRENIDLYVQYQLRVTDSNIPRLRNFAVRKFNNYHAKDKIIGAILMLMDQGLYEIEPLLNATVSDLEFIDNTVKLLGRKFICDPILLDFLTSLVGSRDPEAPLFVLMTFRGEGRIGVRHIASVLKYLRVSPAYILAWHASHMYSRVLNRLATEDVDPQEIDGMALSELKRAFGTQKDLQYLVDVKLRDLLLENYDLGSLDKSIIPRVEADDYATLTVFSDLMGRREDEVEFSTWLHAQPMHDITPEEQAILDQETAAALEAEEGGEEADVEGGGEEEEEAPADSAVADQEEGAVDSEKTPIPGEDE